MGACRRCTSSERWSDAATRDAGVGAGAGAGAGDADAGRLALFVGELDDPYNELHALLFARSERRLYWTGCDDCLNEVVVGIGAPAAAGRIEIPAYAERPIFEVSAAEAAALVSRSAAIEGVTARLAKIEPTQRALAAILLQHDVWRVFDALGQGGSDQEVALRKTLARAIRYLALPRDAIRALRPTLNELEELDHSLGQHDASSSSTSSGLSLIEFVAEESEPPSAAPRVMTTHARLHGARSVFRRFVQIPGGQPALDALLANSPERWSLPEGSAALIVESPFAVTKEGELASTPLVTLVERRRIMPTPTPTPTTPPRLRELGFDVFHLTARHGLTKIDPAAPFPALGSCGHASDTFVPMRRSCIVCHGIDGKEVRSFAHGPALFRLPSKPAEAEEVVLADKRQRADYKTLRSLIEHD